MLSLITLYGTDSLDELSFVFVCDLDVHSTRLQLDRHKLSEPLLLEGKCLLNAIRDIVPQHPPHTSIELGVSVFKVTERDLFLSDHLVEARDDVCVEKSAIEDSQADNPTNEFEVAKVLLVDTRHGGDLDGVVFVCRVLEQAVERVKYLA